MAPKLKKPRGADTQFFSASSIPGHIQRPWRWGSPAGGSHATKREFESTLRRLKAGWCVVESGVDVGRYERPSACFTKKASAQRWRDILRWREQDQLERDDQVCARHELWRDSYAYIGKTLDELKRKGKLDAELLAAPREKMKLERKVYRYRSKECRERLKDNIARNRKRKITVAKWRPRGDEKRNFEAYRARFKGAD